MKGFVFSSDPSGPRFVTVWSSFMGAVGLWGAYNGFTSPGDWRMGLISLLAGFLYVSLLVRTWGQFRDVFVDFGGVTIVRNDYQQAFSWRDVSECKKVPWAPPVPMSRVRWTQVYRLSFKSTDSVAYFTPDRSGGRLLGNGESMIEMIKREMGEARGK
jgi:hypothetical protein